eukprot:m.114250 g.114250  ORF g.114250 m.114250 type:complete len:492 (-) comp9442_c0_seq5:229-1704(-)
MFGICASPDPKELTIAFVGLDEAGKSAILAALQKEDPALVRPTVGFGNVEFGFKRRNLTVFDLGGGARIRDIWGRYYAEIYGIVFVVDASDRARIGEAREVFQAMMEHEFVAGKPVLVLANKQDKMDAMSSEVLFENFGIADLGNTTHSQFNVQNCTATRNKPHKGVIAGLKWLIRTISVHYDELLPRVTAQTEQQQEVERKEREAKRERIRQRKEAQERAEAEAAAGEARSPESEALSLPNSVADPDSEKGSKAELSGARTVQVKSLSPIPQRKLHSSAREAPSEDALSDTSFLHHLDKSSEPSLDDLTLKVIVSLNIFYHWEHDAEHGTFHYETIRSGIQRAWIALRKQCELQDRFSVQRIAAKVHKGWSLAATETWDAEAYGPKPASLAKDDLGLYKEDAFSVAGGYKLYRKRMGFALSGFDTLHSREKGRDYVIAELLLDQFLRCHPEAKSVRVRRRDRKIAAAVSSKGLIEYTLVDDGGSGAGSAA